VAKKRWISNHAIILIKLITALILFFACCLFFFQDIETFEQDLGLNGAPLTWNVIFPIIFVLGVVFIITYVTNMVVRFESKTVWKADRMYIMYQIVYVAVMAVMIWRWFLVDMSNSLYPSAIMIIAGIITLLTPKIIDNNNDEF